VLAKAVIPAGADWSETAVKFASVPTDLRNLIVSTPESINVEIDWGSFE
jgi:hypothetical protein